MSFIRFLCFFVFVLFFKGFTFAQDGFVEVTYPRFQSPQAHSLGVFGEIPVSMYTGVPDISIPITTVSAGNYTLPISLNYHPSNVKATSKASWVGLGWALNAGGVITRSVKGCADDETYGYYYQGYRLYDADFWNTPFDTAKDVNVINPQATTRHSILGYTQTGKCMNGESSNYDFEPDEFFYNFGGRSGRFVLPPKPSSGDPDIRTIPASKLKITPKFAIDKQIIGFDVINESGVKFVFDAIETHDNSYSLWAGGTGTIVTDNISWYLTEIIPPSSSEIITLSYSEPESAKYFSRSIQGNHWYNEVADSAYDEIDFFINANGLEHKIRRLTSIESDVAKVVFNTAPNPDRFDSPLQNHFGLEKQEYSLHSIDIKTKDNKLVLSWAFNFSYFNNSVQNQLDSTPINTPDLWKRLRLDSIEVRESSGADAYHYQFEYSTGNYEHLEYDPITDQMVGTGVFYSLPPFLDIPQFNISPVHHYSLMSYPQYDHWGYFNGRVNSLYNIPFLDYTNTQVISSKGPKSVDRAPNENAMKVGVLSKVIYPTGGVTTYEFEANTYDAVGNTKQSSPLLGGGLRIKHIKSYSSPGADPIVKSYLYEEVDGTTSGAIVSEPSYLKPYFGLSFADLGRVFADQRFYDNSTFELGNTKGGVVGYKRVTELSGLNEEHGKTVYSFTNPEHVTNTYVKSFWGTPYVSGAANPEQNFEDSYEAFYLDYMVHRNTTFTSNYSVNKWGFGQRTNLDSRRGLLTLKQVFNSSGVLTAKEAYDYFESFDESSPGLQYHQVLRGLSVEAVPHQNVFGWTEVSVGGEQAYGLQYEVISSWNYLKQKTTTIYDSSTGDSLKAVEKFYHEDSSHLELTKKEEINSDSTNKVTTYTYAHEQASYGAMEGLNMLTQPYSVLVEDGSGNDLSKSWIEWTNNSTISPGSKWHPWKSWQWEGGSASNPPSSANAVLTSQVNLYDGYGNPLVVEDADGHQTRYYYGSVAAPFSQDGFNGVNGVYLTGIERVKSGTNLRTQAEYDNKGNLIKVTDENNQTTSYGYDNFNRLITTTNANGFVVAANGYGYSATRNSGTYSASDPNTVESITYIDPFYRTDFSSSTGWVSVNPTYNTFGIEKAGQTTVRMGGPGAYETMYMEPDAEDLIARVDFYPDNTTGGVPYIYLDSGGDRFAVQYHPIDDEFRMQYRVNSGAFVYPFTFPLDASIDRWYTIELQKSGSDLTAWVYPKGEGRHSANTYTLTGAFPSTWKPHFRLTTNDNYFYAANLSIATSSQSTITYLDGLGRNIQSQVRGGTETILTETRYNQRGLPEVASRPILKTGVSGYVANLMGATFAPDPATPGSLPLPATSEVENYYDTVAPTGEEDYAYSYTQYEASPLARVEKATLPGSAHKIGSGKEVETTYGLNTTETFATAAQGSTPAKTWAANTLSKTITEDPDGKKNITYTDGLAQTIASGVDMNGDSKLTRGSTDLVTEFAYDLRGNLVRVEDPRGLATTYTYNQLGQLIDKKLPDQDAKVDFRYDDKGRLRFTEFPKHHSNGSMSTLYDAHLYSDQTLAVPGDGILTFDLFFSPSSPDDEIDFDLEYESGSDIFSHYFTAWEDAAEGKHPVSKGNYRLNQQVMFADGQYGLYTEVTYTPNKFTYNNYDEFDRITETGEYYGPTSFTSMDANAEVLIYKTPMQRYFYGPANAKAGANNTKGRLAKVEYRDVHSYNSWGTTWYSYNTLGLVEWIVQDLPGSTMGEKKIEYTYDELGRMTRMFFNPSGTGDDHYTWYYYDELGRLAKVSSYGSNNEGAALTEAEYTYYADGQVKQQKLGGGAQTIDYTYTVQGWLDKINDGTTSGTDKFGMDLGYDYNGNISLQQWKQAAAPNTNTLTYNYSYDDANRLTSACYGSGDHTCQFVGASTYDTKYYYDKNGNITSLDRYNNSGVNFHDFGFTFVSNTNKLSLIYIDGDDFSVSYDKNGNMTGNAYSGMSSVNYDERNLPSWMVANGSSLLYNYDGDGNRVKKEVVGGATIYYIRGADGQTVAAYNGSGTLLFTNILAGGEVIGQIEN